MQDTSGSTVAEWLISLGMSEYADSFARNDIDFDVLPELTDQDLERLGVSLGHRRKILRAIRALGPNTSTDVTAAPRAEVVRSARYSCRRAALRNRDVLRSGRFNGNLRAA